MDIPDPVCEHEIAEMKQLYDYGPERACLDRMIWLEVEHEKMNDEIQFFLSEESVMISANEYTDLKQSVKRVSLMEDALKELASMARTTEQLDLVHQLKCRGLIK